MTKDKRVLALAVLTVMAASMVSVASFGQQSRSQRRRRANAGAPVLKNRLADPTNPRSVTPQIFSPPEYSPFLVVQPDPRTSGAARAQHERIAQELTKAHLLPPEIRLAHYQQISHDSLPGIVGWHGFITDIESLPGGGHGATLRVSAKLDGATDSYHILERYVITDAGVRFLGAGFARPAPQRIIMGF